MSRLTRFLFLLFVLLLIHLYGLGFLAYSLYALAGVLLSSWLMSRQSLAGIEHKRTVSRQRCDVGESVTVSVEITNAKSLPVLWMLVEDYVTGRLPVSGERLRVFSMRPGQTGLLRYEVKCLCRGYHAMGPLLFESGDLFGLSRKFRTGSTVDYVTVLPKVVPLTTYGISTHRPIGEVRVQTQIHEDPTRLAGVREYVRGDSLNRVHWKATARTGTLHSKVYEPTTMIGANIVLDFHVDTYEGPEAFERSELAVTTAISLAAYILEHKQQVGFLSNGRDALDRIKEEREGAEVASRSEARRLASEEGTSDRLRPVEVRNRRGDAQLEQMLVTLARLELTDGLSVGEVLLAEYTRLPRDAALIVITGRVDPLLLEVITEVKRSGFVVAMFVINHAVEWERSVVSLAPLGIQCYHVRDERDLADLAVATF
ncbi:MAG: DUF58 domain-containing protein [Armatimonadetes bacterium]|nr:DUF58 domain-containing protein [Armatimonadota bacterium]